MSTNISCKNENYNTSECPEVDSLKIRIPIESVNILDESIKGHWFLINDVSLDIDPQVYKEKCYTYESKGIKIRFAIEKQTNERQEIKEYFVFLINSKILKNRYFEGITKDNIRQVYHEIIALNKVSFSFEDFLFRTACTDVDFKKDRIFYDLPFILQHLCKSAIPSVKKDVGYRLFNKRDNVGMEFSDRRTTSFKSNPFFKIYHKEIELRYHSRDFTEAFLLDIDFKNKGRIEVTVKNKKHFRYLLNLEDTSLNSILNLSKEQKETIISMSTNFHLSREKKKPDKAREQLTPDKQIIFNSMFYMIESGMPIGKIIDYLLDGIEGKTLVSRKRKELKEIYDKNIKGCKEDKRTEEIEQMFDFLNLRSEG